MIRKFTNITCIYHDDKNYIPAKFNCPDLTIDDVLLKLTTNKEDNYEKIASMLVDYAFALYCKGQMEVANFAVNPQAYRRDNWKLLEFKDNTIVTETDNISKPTTTKTSKSNGK